MVGEVFVFRRDRGTRRVDAVNIQPLASEQPVQDANSQRRQFAPLPSPAQAQPRSCALGSDIGAWADGSGCVHIQVLATSLIDAIVVAAQEACDDGAYALGVVAERLVREH